VKAAAAQRCTANTAIAETTERCPSPRPPLSLLSLPLRLRWPLQQAGKRGQRNDAQTQMPRMQSTPSRDARARCTHHRAVRCAPSVCPAPALPCLASAAAKPQQAVWWRPRNSHTASPARKGTTSRPEKGARWTVKNLRSVRTDAPSREAWAGGVAHIRVIAAVICIRALFSCAPALSSDVSGF
jgi:hypothetical protein